MLSDSGDIKYFETINFSASANIVWVRVYLPPALAEEVILSVLCVCVCVFVCLSVCPCALQTKDFRTQKQNNRGLILMVVSCTKSSQHLLSPTFFLVVDQLFN